MSHSIHMLIIQFDTKSLESVIQQLQIVLLYMPYETYETVFSIMYFYKILFFLNLCNHSFARIKLFLPLRK